VSGLSAERDYSIKIDRKLDLSGLGCGPVGGPVNTRGNF
jgi:hypothetical protein